MNIYIKYSQHPKIFGILNALKKTNHKIIEWDNNTNYFNIFDIHPPDIIFITEEDINQAKYILHDYPNIEIFLFKNSKNNYENNYKEINLLDKSSNNFLDYLCDDYFYCNGKENDKFKCDFLIFTNNISNDNNEVLDICCGIGSNFNTKIYGTNKINAVYYLGIPEPYEYKDMIASCKSIIMFDNEFFYTTLYNKKIPLVYNPEPIHHFQFNNYDQLSQICDYVIKHHTINNNLNIQNLTYSSFLKEKLGIV